MIPLGDILLYASLAVSVIALVGLLLKDMKNIEFLNRFAAPAILLVAGLLTFAYLLLTYYFVTGNFAYDYVWQYSSTDLPLVYKLSGTWAGQPGTYLLWVWVVFLSAAWLAWSTKHNSALARRTQIITLITGIYLIILTLIQTPFKLIIERPEVVEMIAKGVMTPDFVPPDGNGLNALLVNFWMIVHPPFMFIGYATMTIPFAAAIIYLLTKADGWEELGRQWTRFTWLILGMGIAVGGVWAYLVLGWGGFWAWDPVETASFIPWLTLTGFMHAAALHRKDKNTFSIAAPMLAVVSFVLVLYAAIVVRSGLFNSVHAFGDSSTGTLLIIMIAITAIVSIVLGMRRYLEEPDKVEEDRGFWNKTNIFYVSLLLFVVLAFISFWGITFPAFIQLTQGLKVGVASDTKNFFNVWSYPFTIIMLLALGFCLNYNEKKKEIQKRTLYMAIVLTIITMFARTENFYVLDHGSPFWVREPPFYKLIGNISVVSLFPSMIYATWAIIKRSLDYLRIESLRPKIKGMGIAIVHFGFIFILFGAVISSNFTQKIEGINIPLSAKGERVDIGRGYDIKIIDFTTRSLAGTATVGGLKISEAVASGKYTVQSVELEVYQNDKKIGSGTAEYLESKGGSGTFPLVDSSITGTDVYVIFQGIGGGVIPLTLRIIPAVNFAWIGIVLFAIGIILIMAVKSRTKL